MTRRPIALLGCAALLLGSVVVAGCVAPALEPPAQAVQELLELRSVNSTDVAGYARYVETTAVAGALAQDAATREGGSSPVPEWDISTVDISGETSASVRVEWQASTDFTDWPEATTFLLRKVDGRWVVVDATEQRSRRGSAGATTTPEP